MISIIVLPYSYPSRCGIWSRGYNDIKSLKKVGVSPTVFSSNIKKGTREKLSKEDDFEGIKIFRFPVLFSLGGTSMFFFFLRKLNQLNPEIVHVHGYRHPHCIQALFWSKLKRKKIFLTAHGPFGKDNKRSIHLKLFDLAYDLFIGWWELKLYDQIIAVADWEIEPLARRGAPKKKIVVIPNSIDDKFFENKIDLYKKGNFNAINVGRVERVKRLDVITRTAEKLKTMNFTIQGQHQDDSLEGIANTENLTIVNKGYNGAEDFIKIVKDQDIFILPSIRESFGIVGLEAMSQGLILVSSNTKGVSQYLKHEENGFIFNSKDELVLILNNIQSGKYDLIKIRKRGFNTSLEYSNEKIGEKLTEIYTKFTSS